MYEQKPDEAELERNDRLDAQVEAYGFIGSVATVTALTCLSINALFTPVAETASQQGRESESAEGQEYQLPTDRPICRALPPLQSYHHDVGPDVYRAHSEASMPPDCLTPAYDKNDQSEMVGAVSGRTAIRSVICVQPFNNRLMLRFAPDPGSGMPAGTIEAFVPFDEATLADAGLTADQLRTCRPDQYQ